MAAGVLYKPIRGTKKPCVSRERAGQIRHNQLLVMPHPARSRPPGLIAVLMAVASLAVATAVWKVPADAGGPVVVGVMEFDAQHLVSQDEWMRSNTRDSLNAILSKVGSDELRVYAKEKIDFLREKRGLSKIEAAESLGIQEMIFGTVSTSDTRVTLEVRVVDVSSGFLRHAFSRSGPKSTLIELQNDAATELLGTLHIPLTEQRKQTLFARRTNDTLESYKLLTRALGVYTEEQPPASPRPPSPAEPVSSGWGIAAAHAQEPSVEQAAIAKLLQDWGQALEAANVDAVAELYVRFDDHQRKILRQYFDNTEDLHVKISGQDIVVEGNEAVATFTRTDEFRETPTGKDVQLELRLSTLLTKQAADWKIRALRKPS